MILNPPRLDSASGPDSDDDDVEWVVSQWRACRLRPGSSTCARTGGLRQRDVTCQRKDHRRRLAGGAGAVGAGESVAGPLCARTERRPASSEPCELLCRQDCVVTPFSLWSPCDVTCRAVNRTRTRQVVVPPRHRGQHCPPFSQTAPCDNCSEAFTYRLGGWGACTLIGNAYRDVQVHHVIGHQSRDVSCLQSKGTLTTLRSVR